MEKPFTAYEGDEPYVFVCYAHADADVIYPEISWLRQQGINIWYDEGISPGAEFPERPGTAILGASAVLFYVSPNSVDSRHCRDEVYFGLDHDAPVLASHLVKTELPPGLALSTGTTQALMRYQHRLKDYRQKLLKDFRRTVDYLESRSDIDSERLAYYGMSWGALMGSIIPAVEKRVKTAILLAGGIYEAGLPEVNSLNYVPRITMPFLMLVGRYDSIVDHEASAVPLFERIGTEDQDKMMKVYETDHIPPKAECITEILAWLDHYFGPVTIAK